MSEVHLQADEFIWTGRIGTAELKDLKRRPKIRSDEFLVVESFVTGNRLKFGLNADRGVTENGHEVAVYSCLTEILPYLEDKTPFVLRIILP